MSRKNRTHCHDSETIEDYEDTPHHASPEQTQDLCKRHLIWHLKSGVLALDLTRGPRGTQAVEESLCQFAQTALLASGVRAYLLTWLIRAIHLRAVCEPHELLDRPDNS